jgi:hypothetical protein
VFVRATDDLAGQLAQALWQYCERPYTYRTPTGREVHIDLAAALARGAGRDGPSTRDAVRRALDDPSDPTALGRMLTALAGSLPYTLVVVIDQAEEVFTLSHGPGGERRRSQALRILSRAGDDDGDYKVIVSLRTEYYGRLIDAVRRGRHGPHGVREYLLTDLDADSLVAAIERPASDRPVPYALEIPRDVYRPSSAAPRSGVRWSDLLGTVARRSPRKRDPGRPVEQPRFREDLCPDQRNQGLEERLEARGRGHRTEPFPSIARTGDASVTQGY